MLAGGRPAQVGNRPLGEIGQRSRFASATGDQVDLRRRLIPAADKCQLAAIGRPSRLAVLCAPRELSGLTSLNIHDPEACLVIIFLAHFLDHKADLCAIG